jgi:hypothetical protein
MTLQDIINELGKTQVSHLHSALEGLFSANNRLSLIVGDSFGDLKRACWPKGSGVYIVRRRNNETPTGIIYIGKAGKFKAPKSGEVELNNGSLEKRLQRFTPYCFQHTGPYENHFEYGPNFGVDKITKQPHEERYQSHLPLDDVEVVTFSTAGIETEVSPAFLESLLLTAYIANEGCLPPANQEL